MAGKKSKSPIDWGQYLWGPVLLALGFVLLYIQYAYNILSFANTISGRVYIEICLALLAGGQCLCFKETQKRVITFFVSFGLTNLGLFAFGLFGLTNDALNGTLITQSSGVWIAFDTLSTPAGSPFVSKAVEFKIIMDTLVGTVPSMCLIVSVVSIWESKNTEEKQTVIIETVMVLFVLVAFAFLGNLFGFKAFSTVIRFNPIGLIRTLSIQPIQNANFAMAAAKSLSGPICA